MIIPRSRAYSELNLADTAGRLPRAELSPEARARMFKRLRSTTTAPPPGEVPDRTPPSGPEDALLHQLAHRLGVSRDAIRRYLGPLGAAQFSQFLGLPGYGGMFAALGWLIRCLQVLDRHGLWL